MNENTQKNHQKNLQISSVLFALSFRPFFLFAGFSALLLIGLWLLILNNTYQIESYFNPLLWHQHEMLFGYTAAVIAGFILSASQTWTGIRSVHGPALFMLCTIWLLARLAILFLPATLAWFIAILDILFFPLVAFYLARQVIKKKQLCNMAFIPILLCFTLANGLMHLQALGLASTAELGFSLGLWLCVLIMTIIGGRVIPFFTKNALPHLTIQQNKTIEIIAVVSLLLTIGFNLFGPEHLSSTFALFAFITHAIRLYSWQPFDTRKTPILWILHTGYAWIVIGLALIALEPILNIPSSLASHSFAVGGIGCLTLGMMARVSLGHTGRPIIPPRIMTLAFLFINLAALFRVFGPMINFSNINLVISISAVCWLFAFTLFIFKYTPFLLSKRIDGKEG